MFCWKKPLEQECIVCLIIIGFHLIFPKLSSLSEVIDLIISLFGSCIKQKVDFWNEAIELIDLHCLNVVAFYGIVFDGPRGSIVILINTVYWGFVTNVLNYEE